MHAKLYVQEFEAQGCSGGANLPHPWGAPFPRPPLAMGAAAVRSRGRAKRKKKGPSTGGGVPKRPGDLTCPSAQGMLQSVQDVDSPGPRLTNKPEMPDCACAEVGVRTRTRYIRADFFLRAPRRHFRHGGWSGRMCTCPAGDGSGARLK